MTFKVLVTGADGQLAKTINKLYANSKSIEWIFAKKLELDITDFTKTKEFFKEHEFNYCVNCAAYTNVEQAEKEHTKANLINGTAVKNLAEICKEKNITLMHISTDYVFDGGNNFPYLETDQTHPINKYGESKLLGELFIQEICKKYFVLRTSWLYSEFERNFLTIITNKAKQQEELKIIDNQIGVPTSTMLVAEFIYFLIKEEVVDYGIYHIVPDGKASWYDFAKEITSYIKDFPVFKISPTNYYPTLAARPKYSVLDNKKVQELNFIIHPWEYYLNSTIKQLSI